MVPRRKLSALWDKKTTHNCVITLWCTKLAITRNQWNLEWFFFEIFCYCDTNKFWQKSVISRLSFRKIFDAQNYLEHRRVHLRVFLRRQKVVLYPPCAQNSPIPRSSEIQMNSPTTFSLLWDKKFFEENRNIPPLMHKIFCCTKFFGTLMRSPDIVFGTVRQEFFDTILCYFPLMHKISDSRK